MESGITKSAGATFSATYLTAHSSTGQSQSVTFAQSPPKSAVITPSGSFYLNGSSVTECQGSGSSATCTSLPSNLTSSLTGLTNLFSPGILTNTLKGIQAEEAAHVGVIVNESSGTYGGLASTCVTVKGSSQPFAVTYCAANFERDPLLRQCRWQHGDLDRVLYQPTGVDLLASCRGDRADHPHRRLIPTGGRPPTLLSGADLRLVRFALEGPATACRSSCRRWW